MAVLSDYTDGTITVTNGSVDFTGTNTLWRSAAFREGDTVLLQGFTGVIAGTSDDDPLILSNTAGQFTEPWPGASGTFAYRMRYQPDNARFSAKSTMLINLLANGILRGIADIGVEDGKLLIGNVAGLYDLIDKSELGIQDPNGSLGKLAALTLAANKFLNTDGSGNLTQSDITAAALVLLKLAGTAVANKLPFFDSATTAGLADFTTAARALLNLTGTAAANQLPYLTADNAAALTPLTAFARSILDDANGPAMFATMGTTQSLGGTGYVKLPNGLVIQWGSPNVSPSAGGYAQIAFPAAFVNTNWVAATMNSQYLANPQMLILQNRDALSSLALDVRLIHAATGAPITTLSRVNWIAVGG
ncbi:gp53-like domain-containing protein [Brucella intermedia]|uniref:gp53-like domain-containing protein n=1 Tax=Brucella intermedia TaxID=94625 RepID=UPI00224B53DD|nr:hypothetical protein [Brucella intermedia]